MLYLDYLSYNNKFKKVNILEKLLAGGGGLLLAVLLPHRLTLGTIALVMSILTLMAGIPLSYLVRLWLAPLVFLLVSLVSVVVSISSAPFPAVWITPIGGWYLGIAEGGIVMAADLFLRSTAAVSCLYFIAATTPAAYIVAYLSRLPVLRETMEIMLLTYRFIFVILDAAGQIYTAQQSRLGHATLLSTLRSLNLLAANLGRKSFLTAREVYIALLARNYTDRLIYRYPRQPLSFFRTAGIAALLAVIGLTSLY